MSKVRTEEDVYDTLTTLQNLLNECLDSCNQENSFTIKAIDFDTMKLTVEFDIVEIEEDDYVGFAGY